MEVAVVTYPLKVLLEAGRSVRILHQPFFMPHRIIEINELTQLVADCLLLDDQQSLVSLACTCRALKEQALSTLWPEQPSLGTLIKSTLTPGISPSLQLLRQPTRAEWDKFRRYASWMRVLDFGMDPGIPKKVLDMISANSPNGILFPWLRELTIAPGSSTLAFYYLFLSPHLTSFEFLSAFFPVQVPGEVLSNLTSAIMELPTSSLQHLHIDLKIAEEVIPTALKLAISSTVLRCGPSLTTLYISVPLSDAALKHIMRLPKLSRWKAMNVPPKVSDLSLPLAFPQLETLELHDEASLGWLPFFEATTLRPSGQDTRVLSHRGPCQTLTVLDLRVDTVVDAALMSPIMLFHGLVILALESSCSGAGGCAFSLTDDDVAAVATALPNLVDATFGRVCSANSCQTTVSSLAFLSTCCKNLKNLEIHFNLTNLLDDFKSIPKDPRHRDLCARPKCRLEWLMVSDAPPLKGEDYGPAMTGFFGIFPLLRGVLGRRMGRNRIRTVQ